MSEQKRVIVLEDLAPEGLAHLAGEGLAVESGAGWDGAELLRRLPGCHGLVVGAAHCVSAETLRAAADLLVVGRSGARLDGIDVEAATRRGVIVVGTPEINAVSAAEQALALLLACAGDLLAKDRDLRAGRWEPRAWTGASVDVSGRTLGIVGLGGVAPLLAERALALGLRVLAWDPAIAVGQAQAPTAESLEEPGRLYAEADFVVVDSPVGGAADTRVGAAELAQMKGGARLICLARRGAVDAAAWARAVADGRLGASALAVYPGEVPDAELLALDDVLLAPSLDEATVDARLRAGLAVAEQVAAVLRGGYAENAVNLPFGPADDAGELMPYLGLCTQLGRMLVGLAGHPFDVVEISYGGSFTYFDTRILTLGVLSGVLANQVDGRVNYVNAQAIAGERGLVAREVKASDLPDFPRLITVTAQRAEGEVSVSGTALGPARKPRLVKVFGEDIDIDPAPHMAFLGYVDAPGVGGAVGTLLGEWGVNIRHMSVGRGAGKREAVMALTLDEPLGAERIDELVKRCGLAYGRGVEL